MKICNGCEEVINEEMLYGVYKHRWYCLKCTIDYAVEDEYPELDRFKPIDK